MMIVIVLLALIGFCVSVYTYRLEATIKKQPTYRPVCDISDHISCTKPMLSPYANIFYFSNALVSTTYYVLVAVLAMLGEYKLLFVAALIACIISAYLAYLLYFKIKSLCLLCTTLYIVNILILGLTAHHLYFS